MKALAFVPRLAVFLIDLALTVRERRRRANHRARMLDLARRAHAQERRAELSGEFMREGD